ncbi:glycosyl transferase [Rhodobacteraceae bacterium CCMM004]|nr:glycosyl transferase [Rhodobacteraceae bacterium CCMM004]
MASFDIVHAGDLRYRGGTSAALRTEFAAAAAHGLNVAALPFLGGRTRFVEDTEPRLAAVMRQGRVPHLHPEAPVRCRVLLAHHPQVFQEMPHRAVATRPEAVVCVLHHPPYDGAGRPQYDIARVAEVLEATFAAPVRFAPVSPVVRAQIADAGGLDVALTARDWPNLVDVDAWRPAVERPAPRDTAAIGRHSRADPLKWPDDAAAFRAAYPDDPRFAYRILGVADLPHDLERPARWQVQPFTDRGVAAFLHSLDFFVYFHSSEWVEAFGIAVAEAMAAGVVTVLPPYLEAVFGDGAVYCTPSEVREVLSFYLDRPDEYRRQARAGQDLIAARYGYGAFPGRVAALFADLGLAPPTLSALTPQVAPADPLPPAPTIAPPRPERVLCVCGNGVGLGHITRLMAVAGHLPDGIEPVFLTLSPATGLIRDAGYAADYLPSHTRAGVTAESWNEGFAVDLMAMLRAGGFRSVIYDGNDAFPGMREVMRLRPDLGWIWIRRAMWQSHHRVNPESEALFHMVLEPGELAAAVDRGDTVGKVGTIALPPVLSLAPDARLDRDAAARALDLDPARPTAVVQLGSQSNFDTAEVAQRISAALAKRGVQTVALSNPLGPPATDLPPEVRACVSYPFYRYSRVADVMICPAGYNAFHENSLGGIPAIYVPNEAREMDDQLLRARWAEVAGLAWVLRADMGARAGAVIDAALAPGAAAEVARRAARLDRRDGAAEAAQAILHFLLSVRTNRPLADTLARWPDTA